MSEWKKWGIQVGIYQGAPILLGENGLNTMRIDQAARFATEAEAAQRLIGMQGPVHLIDLDDLKHEQSFEGDDE
jgi:hypothetical protein